jgi:MIP family channel proteins
METRKYLAELVGTFLFMTIGYLSVAAVGGSATTVPGLLVVPFSFGLGLLAAIFAVGHISGGHFNPAVTVAALLDRRTEVTDAIGYILAQVIGAIAAAVVVFVVSGQGAVAAGITQPGGGVSQIGALIIEFVLTAGFVLVILVCMQRAAALAALAIPLTLVAIHFASATLSGASVNPARSIGSALIGGDLSALWIYLVGPIAGAIAGWALYWVLAREETEADAAPAEPTA